MISKVIEELGDTYRIAVIEDAAYWLVITESEEADARRLYEHRRNGKADFPSFTSAVYEWSKPGGAFGYRTWAKPEVQEIRKSELRIASAIRAAAEGRQA